MNKKYALLTLIIALMLVLSACDNETASDKTENSGTGNASESAEVISNGDPAGEQESSEKTDTTENYSEEDKQNEGEDIDKKTESANEADAESGDNQSEAVADNNIDKESKEELNSADDNEKSGTSGSENSSSENKTAEITTDNSSQNTEKKDDYTTKPTMLLSEAVVHEGGGWTHYMGTAKGSRKKYINISELLNYVEVIKVTPENWKDYFEVYSYDHCYSYINNILQEYNGEYQVFLGPKEEYYYWTPYEYTFGSKTTGKAFKQFALIVEDGKIYRVDNKYTKYPFDFEDVMCISTDIVLYKINIPDEYVWVDNSEGFNKYYVNILDDVIGQDTPEACLYEEIYKVVRLITQE